MNQIQSGLLLAALTGSLFLAGLGGFDSARPVDKASQCALPLQKADGLQAFSGFNGDGSVQARDNVTVSSTPMGYLVGWSMQAESLQ